MSLQSPDQPRQARVDLPLRIIPVLIRHYSGVPYTPLEIQRLRRNFDSKDLLERNEITSSRIKKCLEALDALLEEIDPRIIEYIKKTSFERIFVSATGEGNFERVANLLVGFGEKNSDIPRLNGSLGGYLAGQDVILLSSCPDGADLELVTCEEVAHRLMYAVRPPDIRDFCTSIIGAFRRETALPAGYSEYYSVPEEQIAKAIVVRMFTHMGRDISEAPLLKGREPEYWVASQHGESIIQQYGWPRILTRNYPNHFQEGRLVPDFQQNNNQSE